MKVDLFTVSVFHFSVKEWAKERDHILGMIPETNNAEDHIKYTDYFEFKIPEYQNAVVDLIEPYLTKFYEIANYKFNGIKNMWCQKYDARDYHCPHDHGSLGYSCVLYAKMNQEHPSTLFFSPFNDETGTHQCSSLPCKEGDIIIFPSNLMHMAPPHDSEEERIIISFNLV